MRQGLILACVTMCCISLISVAAQAQQSAGDYGMSLVLPIPDSLAQTITRGYNTTGIRCCTQTITTDCTSHCLRSSPMADDRYALDIAGLSDCSGYETPVLAAASGTVKLNDYSDPGWTNGYGLAHVVIDHGNGCLSHYAHLESNVVYDGQYVSQGEMIGRQGNEGAVSFQTPCSNTSASGSHLHFKVVCDGVAVLPEPLSEYTNHQAGKTFRQEGYTHFPVGTLIKTPEDPKIYLVVSDSEILHIPDWFTFTSHRFFYDPSRPNQRIVTVSQATIDCYFRLSGNSSWAEYDLVECGDGDYVVFRENGGPFLRRKVPFSLETRYIALLKSWGLEFSDRRTGTAPECSASAATGGSLTMRPGTVVEEASETNFYVITSDSYNGDDVQQWFPSTKAVRLNRFESSEPFMATLLGSFEQVIMIPDTTINDFVSTPFTGEVFQPVHALECPAAVCTNNCGGYGGGSSGAGSQSCSDTAQRACSNGTDYMFCQEVSLGVFEWSDPFPCGVGWECTNSEGQCTQTPYNCTPGSTVCYGSTHDATCAYNSSTGIYDYVPSVCGAGYECITPSTQCAEASPDPGADPQHTIRCVDHDYTYSMFITGPVQNGLWGSVSGQEVFLEYGSNSDGWSSYTPSVGSKPNSLWVGDTDGQGNPYIHELVMKGNTDQMNLFMFSPDSGQQQWFNLDWGIWTVTGDCYQQGTLIRHDPLPAPSGTIVCSQEGSNMRYIFDGPMQMLLVGGAASGPLEIQYGSNTDGWSMPTSGKPTAPWNGTYHHEIVLPLSTNELNFYLHGSSASQWFDLTDADWDGDSWTVSGDCYHDSGLIKH